MYLLQLVNGVKIKNLRNISIIGGAGRVGLPLALVLSQCEFNVWSIDIDKIAIEKISKKEMPFLEIGAQKILDENLGKTFHVTDDFNTLNNSEVIFIVLGTELDQYQQPNSTNFVNSIVELLPFFAEEKIIILRSTIAPGLYRKVEEIIREVYPKIIMGYCPERILEGNALEELRKLPQVIGVRSDLEFATIEKIFTRLGVKTIKSTPEEAELVKLFTNTWRYAKFAIANEFWKISNEFDLDYNKIREIITLDYPRANDLPKAGFAAGPCLYKDTVQLYSVLSSSFSLGFQAININENLPLYLIEKISNIYNLNDLNVGLLGLTFKANSDDVRNSLSLKLLERLKLLSKTVKAFDPYIDNNLTILKEILENSDLIIIGTPHDDFKNLIFNCPVIDIWGSIKRSAKIE